MKILRPLLASILAAIALSRFAALPACADENIELGIQTWTLRNLKFDQAVEFAVKHGIRKLSMSLQFDPKASREEILRQKAVLDQNGLTAYTFGVAATTLDKEQNRKLFEAAKLLGMRQIVVEPPDFKNFDQLEELVRE